MKPKNEAAATLGRARWAKTTKEQRAAHAAKMLTARWGKTRKPKAKKPAGTT